MKYIRIEDKKATLVFDDRANVPSNAIDNIVCGKCAHCCYNMMIPIDIIEEETLRALFEQVRNRKFNPPQKKAIGLGKKSPCTMLDTETNKCRVYDNRPRVCQYYYSTNVAHCIRFMEEAIEGKEETVSNCLFSVMKDAPVRVTNAHIDIEAAVEIALHLLSKDLRTSFNSFYHTLAAIATRELGEPIQEAELSGPF